MISKTVFLPIEKAAKVQKAAPVYNCAVFNVAVGSNQQASVAVSGEYEDLKKLFESIGENFE